MRRIGQMRHRIIIERLAEGSPSQDAGGTPSVTWTTFSTEWCEITPLQGRELLAAQQMNAEVTGKVRMRYRPGVTAEMRINFGGRYMDILAVTNISERNRELVLFTKEGVSVGG